jgi:kinesin family protein C1
LQGKSSSPHEFQRVFTPRDSQAVVFDELGEFIQVFSVPFVIDFVTNDHQFQSALHGFNVTILAFGQTGSGKTFTMQGGSSESTMGIIPRAVRLIFTAKKELTDLGWKVRALRFFEQTLI